jgi:hypothetical protein
MQQELQTNQTAKRFSLILIAAFAAVYIFWGSTYLAIKYAIETLPPCLMLARVLFSPVRFSHLWARFSKITKKDFEHWRTSFMLERFCFWAETAAWFSRSIIFHQPIAALLVATETVLDCYARGSG